jgi:hypothetical protein
MGIDIWLTINVDTGGEPYDATLFECSATHNLGRMWARAGVYDALYNSDGKQAGEIAGVLLAGLEEMQTKPDDYKPLSPPNGWGTYDGALDFLGRLARACQAYPKAIVRVSK